MANGNPLEEYLSSDVDESVINALVGSLESQLASPTSKEQPRQKSQLNALPNHIKSDLNSIQNQHTSEAGQKTGLNLQNQNHSNSNTVGTVKTQVPNTQIIGINSVGPGSPSLGVGKAPTPKIIVNSSGVVQRSTSSNPISTSVSQQVISVINNTNAQNVVQQVINSAQRNIANHKNTAASGMAQDNPSAMYGLAAVAAEQKPMMVPKSETLTPQAVASLAHNPNVSIQNSHQSPSAQFVIKSETNNSAVPIKVEPTGRVTPQQTVVNIVSTRSSTPVSTGAIVNTFTPSPQTVTIVRTQAPANSQQIVVNTGRSQQKTIAPRMVTAQQQHRMVSSGPVRIASSPQQIIAPRLPGNPGTITLPPGVKLPPGSVLMQNEQGQLMVVQQGQQSLQQQTSGSTIQLKPGMTTTGVTQIRQQIPNIIRPTQGTSSIRPAVNISSIQRPGVAIQQLSQQQNIVPQPTQTMVSEQTPQLSQSMLENVKKCKNFLSTLIKLASNQPQATVKNVKDLIQGLIDGKIEPEMFTRQLQIELKSSPQPYLVPFLKKSLPYLRQSLLQNKMHIEGVKAPPLEVLQKYPPMPITPTTSHTSTVSTLHTQKSGKANLQHHQKGGSAIGVGGSGIGPSSMSMLHNSGVRRQAESPAPSHHKEKRKFESLKEDDDINDVATMGGVNLSEESRNILATNSDLVGTHIRSCKDEQFLISQPLVNKINAIARRHGLDDISPDVANLVSHATQERLRSIVEKLSTVAEHRLEIFKADSKYEVTTEVRPQLKFLEELDKVEKRRHEDLERETLLRAAKSRSKHEDPEQLKLKQRAKEMQAMEMEVIRQKEANLTALAAIGPRKKKKVDLDSSQSGLGASGSSSNMGTSPRVSARQRVKRVNLRDLIFLLEQEAPTAKSNLLYKAYLK